MEIEIKEMQIEIIERAIDITKTFFVYLLFYGILVYIIFKLVDYINEVDDRDSYKDYLNIRRKEKIFTKQNIMVYIAWGAIFGLVSLIVYSILFIRIKF